jgi:hypothetical protein
VVITSTYTLTDEKDSLTRDHTNTNSGKGIGENIDNIGEPANRRPDAARLPLATRNL